MRRLRSLLVAVVTVALLSGCIGPFAPNSGTGSDADGGGADDGGIAISREQLESAGIVIVDAEAAVPAEATALVVTELQADRIIAEAAVGAGLTGAQIDAIAPVDPTYPSMSYVLAAYISADDLPGELRGPALVRDLYPADTDWTHPRELVFPTAVLALFVEDMMTAALDESSFVGSDPADASSAPRPRSGVGDIGPRIQPAAHAVVDAPCSAVTGFIASTIQSLFDVLRVIPGAITKINELGIFGQIIAAILNHAIGLAQSVVEGLVATITAPVLNAIRVGLSGLGTATLVLSYFTNERLVVKAAPADHTAFAIDPAPGTKGTFTASTKSLTDKWPQALVDCAKVSGAEIPPLIREGDPANWSLTAGDSLIALDSASTKITAAKTAEMGFTTGTEDAETAKGPEITEAARVSVTVPRKEVGDFLDLAAKQVENAKNDILAKVPELFRGAATTVLNAAIDPIVASMRASLEGVAGGIGMLNLAGEGYVWVTHHQPKEPDPEPAPAPDPEPAPDGDGDFCAQFDEQAAIAAAALPGAADPFSWAGQFAAGLHSITATPPADLSGDFATVVAFYDIAATSSFENAQTLADFVAANDIDGARVRLWTACGATQIDTGF
jgi:hypothetical protein